MIITIDGFSGAGKTTLAESLSEHFNVSWVTQSRRNLGGVIKDTYYDVLWCACRHISEPYIWQNKFKVFRSVAILPALSLYLKVPYAVSLQRRGAEVDPIVAQEVDIRSIRFWEVMQETLDNLYIIDGTQPKDVVFAEALEIIHQSGVMDGI